MQFNFLFPGSDGRRYIGTAGHCILGDSPFGGDAGEATWAPGSGPVARDGAGDRIGEVAGDRIDEVANGFSRTPRTSP